MSTKRIVYALQLRFKYDKILNMEKGCKLCPVACKADRTQQAGYCGATNKLKIAKYGLHFFEEPCISYEKGSGTVFFCGCSLKCVFCQNYEVSRARRGKEISVQELADIFYELENIGAENINLVTAGHFVPQIIEAFKLYRPKIPVVYNTHSYENISTLKAIDKYVDVYLPDLKYFSPNISKRYTNKEDYFEKATKAIAFMMQKPLDIKNGKMYSGCIVRHLMLPLCSNDSIEIAKWFFSHKTDAYFSLMSQYTPFGDIDAFPELKRRITKREYQKVVDFILLQNSEKVFLQELASSDKKYIPDWDY